MDSESFIDSLDPKILRQWETLADVDGWDKKDDRFSMLLATIWNGCMAIRGSMVESSDNEFKSPNDFKNGMMETFFQSFEETKKKKLSAKESQELAAKQQARQCREK